MKSVVWQTLLLGFLAIGLVGGCDTDTKFMAVNGLSGRSYSTAYVVRHNEEKAEMPEHLERSLSRLGLSVTSGVEAAIPAKVDLIVRYGDRWRWDLVMYLAAFDLDVHDPATGAIIASGSWKNSWLHGFHSEKQVVDDVVMKTFAGLGIKPAMTEVKPEGNVQGP